MVTSLFCLRSAAITAREFVQIVTVITSATGLYLWVRFYFKHPRQRYLVVAPLSIIIHTLIFYSTVAIIGLNSEVIIFTNWSAALRLHGMFIMIIMALQISEECGRHGR